MAVELEQTIMKEIGLGNNYRFYNGSGSCRYIRNKAIELLPDKMKEHGLSLSPDWKKILNRASQADELDGQEYTLTNVWVTASYAIQDGIYRNEEIKDGTKFWKIKGIPASEEHFCFFEKKAKETWNHLKNDFNAFMPKNSRKVRPKLGMKMKGKFISPDQITYYTELDLQYASELKNIVTSDEFGAFIKKWNYWLDDDCKDLKSDDWLEMKSLIADCRKSNIEYTKKHDIATELCLPKKIFFISIMTEQYKVPWGCAYIRAKEEKIIDY